MEKEEKINLYPLGSIVTIKGGYRKYMIVSRGIQVNINSNDNYFDYGACLYPEGMIGDKVMYCQHKDISKVIYKGLEDEDNEVMLENIQSAFERLNLKHADTMKLNTINENGNN